MYNHFKPLGFNDLFFLLGADLGWRIASNPKESKNYLGGGLGLMEGGKNGKFDVKEAYGLLTSHSTPLFPKKGIWVENVPSKVAFFAGKLLGGGFLLWIGFKREDDRFLIGVIYVVVMRKVLIIFLFIVQWLVCCGGWFLVCLEPSGSFQKL